MCILKIKANNWNAYSIQVYVNIYGEWILN